MPATSTPATPTSPVVSPAPVLVKPTQAQSIPILRQQAKANETLAGTGVSVYVFAAVAVTMIVGGLVIVKRGV